MISTHAHVLQHGQLATTVKDTAGDEPISAKVVGQMLCAVSLYILLLLFLCQSILSVQKVIESLRLASATLSV